MLMLLLYFIPIVSSNALLPTTAANPLILLPCSLQQVWKTPLFGEMIAHAAVIIVEELEKQSAEA